ncbi:MAG: signal peptidase I [Lachnospirales bacterium]
MSIDNNDFIEEINKNSIEEDNEILNTKISWKSEIISWIKTIIFCVIMAYLINNLVIVNAEVPTSSMENTIMTEDRLIANRLAYTFSDPERFDIIVFKWPDDETQNYVKRIIGLPGDTIEIKGGLLYINGVLTEEPYLKETPFDQDYGPYNVPEGHYFTLGDNRNWSKDSRLWENTYVPRENIVAKPLFRYLPNFKILIND